jgi:hypothetical protein
MQLSWQPAYSHNSDVIAQNTAYQRRADNVRHALDMELDPRVCNGPVAIEITLTHVRAEWLSGWVAEWRSGVIVQANALIEVIRHLIWWPSHMCLFAAPFASLSISQMSYRPRWFDYCQQRTETGAWAQAIVVGSDRRRQKPNCKEAGVAAYVPIWRVSSAGK